MLKREQLELAAEKYRFLLSYTIEVLENVTFEYGTTCDAGSCTFQTWLDLPHLIVFLMSFLYFEIVLV